MHVTEPTQEVAKSKRATKRHQQQVVSHNCLNKITWMGLLIKNTEQCSHTMLLKIDQPVSTGPDAALSIAIKDTMQVVLGSTEQRQGDTCSIPLLERKTPSTDLNTSTAKPESNMFDSEIHPCIRQHAVCLTLQHCRWCFMGPPLTWLSTSMALATLAPCTPTQQTTSSWTF